MRESIPEGVVFSLLMLLDRLAEEEGLTLKRFEARQALEESILRYPGSAEDRATVWLVESAKSVGLRLVATTLPLQEAAGLVRPRDPVAIVRPNADPAIVVLIEHTRGRVKLWDGTVHWVSIRDLARQLGLTDPRGEIDCILVEPHSAYADEHLYPRGQSTKTSGQNDRPEHPGQDTHVSPAQRLRAIARSEWSDLWVVMVFAVVVGVFSLATPLAVEALVTTVMFGSVSQPLLVLSLTLLTFLLAASGLRATQMFVLEILQRRIFVRIVDDLAHRLPRVQTEALAGHDGAELLNRFLETSAVQKLGTTIYLEAITLAVQVVVGMAILALYHPWLIGFDVFLLVSMAFSVFVLGRGAVRSAIDESAAKFETTAWLQDIARCTSGFRLSGASEFAFDRADELAKTYLRRRTRHFRVYFRQLIFVLLLEAVASAILLGIGGLLVVQGRMTLGQLVASELIVTVIIGSLAKFGKHIESYYDLLASVDKVGHLLDLPTEPARGRHTLPSLMGLAVELRDVKYIYEDGARVGPVQATISPGSRVAVVGSSGSGKSTLCDILFGLRQPTSGSVTLDKINLRELHVESLRRDVALARDVEIFDGTIEANVCVGRRGISYEETQRSLAIAGLGDRVLEFPLGINTPLVRTKGSPLTDNQRRLLMLARALAGQPRLLVIDGLLDPLPLDVLEQIVDRIIVECPDMTMVVATWRPEIISRCQTLLELGASIPVDVDSVARNES
jgi:ABC-type bacteriocin/lantibiotic exporter with double-glycine peptidase domain